MFINNPSNFVILIGFSLFFPGFLEFIQGQEKKNTILAKNGLFYSNVY